MKRWTEIVKRYFAAIAFAEEGQWQTADEIIGESKQGRRQMRIRKNQRVRARPRPRLYRT